jgi:septum formation protein
MADAAAELILASTSPRRRELLRQAGYRFKILLPGPIEDTSIRGAPSAAAYVESLAYLKAMAVIETHGIRKGLVLGADTAVELRGRLIGKPRDEEEARQILSALAGSVHRVLTGVALVDPGAGRRWIAHAATTVHMGPMSDADIRAYVASGEAMGKAGAYALQETADRFVERIEGSFTNVVGLPMELLERMLKAAGYEPKDYRDRD